MPIVTVHALEGRTVDQKRGLVKDIAEAVIKNFNVKPEAVTVIIREMKGENFGKAGKLWIDS
ncbi:MAG: 2-hydroxymuconate tautomerase [Chloroflexota bacterium]|nr:2-hydroxymuconate tautomerase [Chloroflexota bacterium]